MYIFFKNKSLPIGICVMNDLDLSTFEGRKEHNRILGVMRNLYDGPVISKKYISNQPSTISIEKTKVSDRLEIIEEVLDIEYEDEDSTNQTSYSFFDADKEYGKLRDFLKGKTETQLLDLLRLSSDSNSDFSKYEKINKRELRTLISIELNGRGIAPYFRDAKSGVFSKSGLTTQQKVESNDRQVIDLHWLYTNHKKVIKTRNEFIREIFSKTEFDFTIASKFVRQPMKVDDKIKKLGISSQIQAELLTIKSSSIRKLQFATTRKAEHAEMLLRDRMQNPRSRFPVSKFNASCAAFKCLSLGNGSLTTAAYYWNFMLTDKLFGETELYEFMNNRKKFFENKLNYSPWRVD